MYWGEVVDRRRLPEVGALDETGRDAELVDRAVGVDRDARVPANLLVVVEDVEQLELDPRAQRIPHRDAVVDREVEQPVAVPRLRSTSFREVDRPRRGSVDIPQVRNDRPLGRGGAEICPDAVGAP